MDWIKTKPPTIKGNIIIQRSDKLLTIIAPEEIIKLNNIGAQELVTRNRPRIFHTWVDNLEQVSNTIDHVKEFWDKYYAEKNGYWDFLDPRIYILKDQYFIHISDIVFKNCNQQIAFYNYFNQQYPNTLLPIDHLTKQYYKYPMLYQTIGDSIFTPVSGTGVTDPYNCSVIDYDNEI